jgi:hypothetical protein
MPLCIQLQINVPSVWSLLCIANNCKSEYLSPRTSKDNLSFYLLNCLSTYDNNKVKSIIIMVAESGLIQVKFCFRENLSVKH